jgi:hypothetical protein
MAYRYITPVIMNVTMDEVQQIVLGRRLFQHLLNPELRRAGGNSRGWQTCHEQDRQHQAAQPEFLGEFQACHSRHVLIEDQAVQGMWKRREECRRRTERHHRVAVKFEQQLQRVKDRPVVIDNSDDASALGFGRLFQSQYHACRRISWRFHPLLDTGGHRHTV